MDTHALTRSIGMFTRLPLQRRSRSMLPLLPLPLITNADDSDRHGVRRHLHTSRARTCARARSVVDGRRVPKGRSERCEQNSGSRFRVLLYQPMTGLQCSTISPSPQGGPIIIIIISIILSK